MGGSCCKSQDAIEKASGEGGLLEVMFSRIDKDNKGYISTKDLEVMMKDDKTFFQGKDVNHIINKYGANGRMTFANFKTWWGSTYTTYNEDGLANIVDEVTEEQRLASIEELPEQLQSSTTIPHNSNVAVSRS